MRDYLYIPLGGNRVKTRARLFFNLSIVFIISGLWHGASWNFVLWGAYHGLFLILDRLFLIRLLMPIGKIPRIILTYIIILVGWVFFRIENMDQAMIFIQNLFSFNFAFSNSFSNEFFLVFLIAILISFSNLKLLDVKFRIPESGIRLQGIKKVVIPAFILVLFVLSLSYIISFGFNPFIYFRF